MKIWGVLLLLVGSAANSASFDCGKAKTRVEKAICADGELGGWDTTIAAGYSKLLKSLSDQSLIDRVKERQKSWLKNRNDCFGKPNDPAGLECLRTALKERNWQLNGPGPDAKPISLTIDSLSVGQSDTCAISAGKVWCWGDNVFGDMQHVDCDTYPWPIPIPGLTGVSQISENFGHTCAIANGELWCWGDNRWGQLGNGEKDEGSHSPVKVKGLTGKISYIATQQTHSCAIVEDKVWCWGSGTYGQLGNGLKKSSPVPVYVKGSEGATMVRIGARSSCAIIKQKVKCWGDGESGQLGNFDRKVSKVPVSVDGLPKKVAQLRTDFEAACALGEGSLRCWGDNKDMRTLSFEPSVDSIQSFALRPSNRGCLESDGKLKCWSEKQNDLMNIKDENLPPGNLTAFGGGYYHVCALVVGRVYCEGNPCFGALGDGRNCVVRDPSLSSDFVEVKFFSY